MENQVTTIVCPNCGASTSGLNNCEYCGSFLVQKARQGVDMTSYRTIAARYQNEGLLNAVKSYMNSIRINPSSLASLYVGKCVMLCNNRTDEIAKNWGCDGTFVAVTFIAEENPDQLRARFKNSNVFSAFTPYSIFEDDNTPIEELDADEIQYYANFGYDAEGACQVILQILKDVYGQNIDEIQYGVDKVELLSASDTSDTSNKKKLSTEQIILLILMIVSAIVYALL